MAKKKEKIEELTITLTPQEVLGLRYIHSNWARSNGDAQFCDAMSDSFLDKLGGYLEVSGALWEHPLAKEWYKVNSECADCQRCFPKEQMSFDEEVDGFVCKECKADLEKRK